MNPLPPPLYSLIKHHKTNYPIRPIVTSVGTIANKMSKQLNQLFLKQFHYQSTYTIKNTTDLIKATKDLKLTAASRLISFDIVSLYTNVPLTEALSALDEFLIEQDITDQQAEDISNLTKICLQQNHFLFDGITYVQPDGLTMGSPLSGLIADLFVDTVEKEIFKIPDSKHISYWGRYVDDVFLVWNGNQEQLDELLIAMNKLSKLQFTMEEEKDGSLNFLDLTITRNNSRLSYNIYRKPTTTDVIIPSNSQHSYTTKMAAFRYYIDRALNVPLTDENHRQELCKIKKIAINNGYKPEDIDYLHKKLKKKNTLKYIYPHKKASQSYRSLTFHPTMNRHIKRICSRNNINIADRNTNNVANLLINNKTPFHTTQKSGVYELKCTNCPKKYIGQCGRSLKERFQEHISRSSSAVYTHMIEEGHKFGIENMTLIRNLQKSTLMNTTEMYHIHKNKMRDKEDTILLNNCIDFPGDYIYKYFK